TPARAVVGQSNAPNFDVVIRRYGDLDIGLHASPSMPEFRSIRTENRSVSRVLYVYRLVRHRPTRVPRFLAQIEERPPTVASGVGAPTRELEVAPATVTGAGIGDHQRITGIAEEVNAGNGRVLIEHTIRGSGRLRDCPNRHCV